MARRFNTTRSFRRSRRDSLWIGIVSAQNGLAAASSAVLSHSFNAAAIALVPFTIVRTRLFMHVRSDQVAASEDYGCALGVAVVGAPAEAIGVTAVPTPDTDSDQDDQH